MVAALTTIALLSLLSGALLLLSFTWRANRAQAFCQACGSDLRDRSSLMTPHCACGANLARFGAVRPGVRRRSRWFLGTAIVLFTLSVAITLWLRRPLEAGESPTDALPAPLLALGVYADASWAFESLERRADKLDLSPRSAAWLVQAVQASAAARQHLPSEVISALLLQLDLATSAGRAALDEALRLHVTTEWHDVDAGVLAITLRTSLSGSSVIRIDGLRVRDRSPVWSIGARTDMFAPARTSRTLIEGVLHVRLAPADRSPGTPIELDLLIGDGGQFAPALAGDALVDSGAPPEDWGVPVAMMPKRLTVLVPEGRAVEEAGKGGTP